MFRVAQPRPPAPAPSSRAQPRRRRVAGPAVLAAMAAVLLSLIGSPVAAQDAPRLTGQVTDQAGVVGSGRASLDAALRDLLDQHKVQLYVAFVRTTGGTPARDFTRETFEANSLGGNDFLLLVAVDDHRYGWWENGAIPTLDPSTVDRDLSDTLEARFRASDYAGGVADFAAVLGKEVEGGAAPASNEPEPGVIPTPIPQTEPSGPSGPLIVAIILIVAGLAIALVWWQQWRRAHLAAEERDRRTGALAREANALLIQADDAVRDSGQELDFAEAQFDEADLAPMRAALETARADLKAAFAIRQQLDDTVPETPEAREQMLGEIVGRSKQVAGVLEEQRRGLQALREQEQRAPQILAAVPGRLAAASDRVPPAEATIATFSAYAPSSWAAVAGNVEEARKRLAAADAESERGQTALAATPPDHRTAGRAARRSDGAIAEAVALLDGIDRMAATLADARGRLGSELDAAAADVQAARAALRSGQTPTDLGPGLDEAEALLAGARRQATSGAPDVISALKDAQRANAAADAVLAGVRAAQEQRARQEAALVAALRSAETSVVQARDFITSRRPGVGREARTRLAEAERHLDEAQMAAGTDSQRALQEATQADRLADEAYALARSDFDDWNTPGGRRGGGGNDLGVLVGGMILGNILGGLGGGGRRGGGGWGGTPWGGGLGGGFGGGFGGGGHGGGGGWSGGGGGGGGGQGGSGSW